MIKRNAGKWTEARYRQFVTSALRSAFRRWPPKSEVLKSARAGTKQHPKMNRMVNAYRCAICGNNHFTYGQMQVDHVKPVVDPKKGFINWDDFISRMFVEGPFLQAVCKPCHKRKTAEERKLHVKRRNAAKKADATRKVRGRSK